MVLFYFVVVNPREHLEILCPFFNFLALLLLPVILWLVSFLLTPNKTLRIFFTVLLSPFIVLGGLLSLFFTVWLVPSEFSGHSALADVIKQSNSREFTVEVYRMDIVGAAGHFVFGVQQVHRLMPGIKWIKHLCGGEAEPTIQFLDRNHIECQFPEKSYYPAARYECTLR
jgi:hypothetical protein